MFKCTNDSDFGVLLIFYPAGSDSSGGTSCTNVNPVASTNYYCTVGNTNAGSDNQLQVQAGANFYVSSSQKYHAVSVFVDTNHPYPSTTLNFTDSTKLSAVGCVTNSCALQIGIGSHVIYVQGAGGFLERTVRTSRSNRELSARDLAAERAQVETQYHETLVRHRARLAALGLGPEVLGAVAPETLPWHARLLA